MKYTKWTDWQETPEGQALFPSKSSLAWYIRLHRDELIQDGVMFKLRNVWQIDSSRFEDWVVAEGLRNTTSQYLNAGRSL